MSYETTKVIAHGPYWRITELNGVRMVEVRQECDEHHSTVATRARRLIETHAPTYALGPYVEMTYMRDRHGYHQNRRVYRMV